MNPLQKTIHLVTTDADFRLALQTDGAAALAQQGLTLSPEETGILDDLRDLLVLPTTSLVDRVQDVLSPVMKRWID